MKAKLAMKFSKFSLFLILIVFQLSVCTLASVAEDITDSVSITSSELSVKSITDNDISTHSGALNVKVSVLSSVPMSGLYIKYNKVPSGGTLDDDTLIAKNGFLHEFIPLDDANLAELFYNDVDICDIQVFSEGDLPNNVQVWQTGDSRTDILLCATHSDDDQLFFAGLLPYYAGAKKANVRVAYFINHFDTYNRTHELLDGLWECGVKNYPDISPFPDGYSESFDGALDFLESKGFTYNDIISFQKSLLEKYKPLIVVLHDFDGEYGHGAHILNTESFIDAFEDDDAFKPEKVYVHLYKENPLVLDIDTPLAEFDGLTAFQVSQNAFRHHKSQHWTWFYEWLYGKNDTKMHSSQIRSYHPNKYGLYYSRVGTDTQKNCLLENVTLYGEREVILPHIPDTDVDTQSKPQTNLPDTNENAKGIFSVTSIAVVAFAVIIFVILFITIKRRDD